MLSNITGRVNIIRNATPLLSVVRGAAAYEGEGKTTVRVINQEYNASLMIDTYATYGFKLNNGLTVLGPMAIFPRTVMSWQVTSADKITEHSLRLFKLLEPKIDLLVLGLDMNSRQVVELVSRATRASGLNVEILPTEHACSTFNFLNSEGRVAREVMPKDKIWIPFIESHPNHPICVAGALIPPTSITNMTEDDMLHTKMHYHDVFNKPL